VKHFDPTHSSLGNGRSGKVALGKKLSFSAYQHLTWGGVCGATKWVPGLLGGDTNISSMGSGVPGVRTKPGREKEKGKDEFRGESAPFRLNPIVSVIKDAWEVGSKVINMVLLEEHLRTRRLWGEGICRLLVIKVENSSFPRGKFSILEIWGADEPKACLGAIP